MSNAPRKIILDRNNSSLLLDAAGRDFNDGFSLPKVEDALLSLVLFDEAEITVENSEQRLIGLDRLQAEGIASPIPKKFFYKPSVLLTSYFQNASADLGTEESFTSFAQEKSFRAIWDLIAANDAKLSMSEYDESMVDLRTWANELGNNSWVYDTNFGDYSEEYADDTSFGLPCPSEYQAHPQFMNELEEHLISRGITENADAFASELRRTNESVPVFLSRYTEMRGIIDRAASTGYPICTNFENKNFKLDTTLGADALQLCRIHLSEVRAVPYLNSIEDILRLRGSPYISNFRESIFEWLDRIGAGEMGVEQKYRNQIKVANKEIQKLDKWRFLDSPYTIGASLMIGVIELFTGTPIGFGLGVASGAATVNRKRTMNKYGYALFRP